MNSQDNYSDEYISAYIDGELDQEERVRLILAEQEDEVLARRIKDTRILKEKVQLAYLELVNDGGQNRTLNRSVLAKRYRSLFAGLLLLSGIAALLMIYVNESDDLTRANQLMTSTQPLMAKSITSVIGTHRHVLIHVSQYREETFGAVIDEIERLLQRHDAAGPLNIEIVANKQGLRVLDVDTSIFSDRLQRLLSQFDTLAVVACAKSLAQLATSDEPVNLLKSIITTPTAAHEVARRTSEGWIYIKV